MRLRGIYQYFKVFKMNTEKKYWYMPFFIRKKVKNEETSG